MRFKKFWRFFLFLILVCALLLLRERTFIGRMPKDINVILLTVDSLRPDHLSCYGYPIKTSPNIDAVAEKGVLFRRAFSQSCWTIPGLMSILTSMQPPVHRVEKRGAILDPGVTTLFDCFAQAEYTVPNICFILSLPEFSGIRIRPVEEEYFSEEDGEELFRWLDKNNSSKFFIWYHYRGVHLPYRPKDMSDSSFSPQQLLEDQMSPGIKAVLSEAATIFADTVKFQQSDRPILNNLYDGEIAELDVFVGKLQARLQKYGLLEKTLLVITADHGDELLDHGFVGHASTARTANTHDEIIRIPLIMSMPSHLPDAVHIHEQAQQIDIMPTLLEIAGIPVPAGVQGRSLAPLIFEPSRRSQSSIPVFAETVYGGLQATEEMEKTKVRCVRTDSWKLIESEGPNGKSHQLFDLLTDIKEHRDVYEQNPDAANLLQTLLEESKRENMVRRGAMTGSPSAIFEGGEELVCPEIIFPYEGLVLRFSERHGMIRASWTGNPTSTYLIEYEIGIGTHHLTGSFLTFGNQRDFGPYSKELWQALAVRNPWRVRISPHTQPRCWSEWQEFWFE